MTQSRFSRLLNLWDPGERRLLYVFIGLFFFFISLAVLVAYWTQDWGFGNLVNGLLSAFLFSTFFMGIPFYPRFRKRGIIPMRRLLYLFLGISLAFAILITTLVVLDTSGVIETGMSVTDETLTAEELIGLTIVLFIGALLAALLSLLLALVFLFGFLGVTFLFMAGLVPLSLRWVRRITMRGHLKARALAWLLLIPEHLDTGTLRVKEVQPEKEFPWKRFQRAFLWQVFFGLMVAVYVSLNPFLLRSAELEELFNFMSNGFVIVPILALPWFITLRLDARIEGPVRDFKLYEGIRSRMLRTFLAIGTIMIFLRFAIEDISPQELIVSFANYTILPWMAEDQPETLETDSSESLETENDDV
jgi:hypothetical protein